MTTACGYYGDTLCRYEHHHRAYHEQRRCRLCIPYRTLGIYAVGRKLYALCGGYMYRLVVQFLITHRLSNEYDCSGYRRIQVPRLYPYRPTPQYFGIHNICDFYPDILAILNLRRR